MESSQTTAELQVSKDGLLAEAGWCESLAGTLAGNSAPIAAAPSALASSAAVHAAHAQIAAAGIRCTVRMQATATTLAVVSAGYGDNEASSAAQLRALSPVMVC
jgi:hypothetical protein